MKNAKENDFNVLVEKFFNGTLPEDQAAELLKKIDEDPKAFEALKTQWRINAMLNVAGDEIDQKSEGLLRSLNYSKADESETERFTANIVRRRKKRSKSKALTFRRPAKKKNASWAFVGIAAMLSIALLLVFFLNKGNNQPNHTEVNPTNTDLPNVAQKNDSTPLPQQPEGVEIKEPRIAKATIGRITYVKSTSTGLAYPRLIRGDGSSGAGIALTPGVTLFEGDKIVTSNPSLQSKLNRQCLAALEMNNGTRIDLADATTVTIVDDSTTQLDKGLVYAESTSMAAKENANYQMVLRTPFASVKTEAAQFDLSHEPVKGTEVKVAAGAINFQHESRILKVAKLHGARAAKAFMSSVAKAITLSEIWFGQKPIGPEISHLVLLYAKNKKTIQAFSPLKNGAIINLANLKSRELSIEAIPTNPVLVESVGFYLNGQKKTVGSGGFESVPPYLLIGDTPEEPNAKPWLPSVGTYKLKVVPYSKDKGKGKSGPAFTIKFTIVDQP